MLSEFRKFVGFKILEFFALNPSRETYIRELARELGISTRSAKIYCDLFENKNILKSYKKGNLRLFKLNNEDFAVKEIKKFCFVLLLKEFEIEKIAKASSLAIYGSFASGDFDERSDLDILVIGDNSDVDREFVLMLEKKLKRKIQLTVIPYYKWEKMKKEKNKFAESVIANHILIKGAEL